MLRIGYISMDRGIDLTAPTGSSVHIAELIAGFTNAGAKVTAFLGVGGGNAGGSDTPLVCPVVDVADDPLLERLRVQVAKELRSAGREATAAAEVYSLLLNQTLTAKLAERASEIDVVYERHSLWSLAGLSFARARGIPYLVEVNAPLATQQSEYRQLALAEAAAEIERMVLTSADLVLATTAELADHAHRCGASRRAIRILPCGVSSAAFVDLARRRPPDADRFVLGFVGTLKPWHGIEIMLEAFRELHAKFEGYRLLVVGDGPMRGEIESFSRRCGLEPYITLTGSVAHRSVTSYLAQMDVGLAPYPALESFYFSPLKVWEYAAAGVPIVASASGEIPSMLPHREAALLHTPGSIGKIVKHVERLRTSADLGPRLARRARRAVRVRTWDRLAARVLRMAETRVAHARRAATT